MTLLETVLVYNIVVWGDRTGNMARMLASMGQDTCPACGRADYWTGTQCNWCGGYGIACEPCNTHHVIGEVCPMDDCDDATWLQDDVDRDAFSGMADATGWQGIGDPTQEDIARVMGRIDRDRVDLTELFMGSAEGDDYI